MIRRINSNVLQSYITSDGYSQSLIGCISFNRKKLIARYKKHKETIANLPIAFSFGGVIPPIGNIVKPPGAPVGIIGIDEDFMSYFNINEINFIIAHEYSHIKMNHVPLTAAGTWGADLFRDYIDTIENDLVRAIVKIGFECLSAKVAVEFTKTFELEADSNAVLLTRDKNSALSTLNKTVVNFAGNNPKNPSHYVKKGGLFIPVVTYEERIDAINRM